MTHVITVLCLRDSGCEDVCPVEAIHPGNPANQWPTYYIDPSSCIDCGACIPECPYHAIYADNEVPAGFKAKGGEFINQVGLSGHYEGRNHRNKPVVLDTVRPLSAGEVIDLRPAIKTNKDFNR
jgi:NAD-dependent dihydropyrimidine dehydrogenase PreA subunit